MSDPNDPVKMPAGIIQWIITAIVVIAAVGILYVVCGVAGVVIPPWVITIGWIVAVAWVAIFAIGLLKRMG